MQRKAQRKPIIVALLLVLTFIVALFVNPIPSHAGSSNQKIDVPISGTLVPQGICFVDNYVIFSAYDSDKKNNSVLWIKDTKNNNMVATVELSTGGHVGGICYDGKYLWITGSANFVQYIRFADIAQQIKNGYIKFSLTSADNNKNACVNITIENGFLPTGTLRDASSITYYDGYLYVTEFDGSTSSNPNPKLTKLKVSYSSSKPNSLKIVDSYALPDRVQGVQLYKKSKTTFAILSCSEGRKKGSLSCIRVYRLESLWGILGKPIKVVDYSKKSEYLMLEGISIKGNYLYAISESAADTYKKDSPNPRSDVLQISLDNLFN